MRFSDLDAEDKKKIFGYTFVVRVIPEIPDGEIRSIFQRLNRNVISLNKQELRQSVYWGLFIKLMNELSDLPVWTDFDIFTNNDIRRMLDVEYMSELTVALLHGLQNKKTSLDKYYEMYEEHFEEENKIRKIFSATTGEITRVLPEIKKTRWQKKSDFYSLFISLSKYTEQLPFNEDIRNILNGNLMLFGDNINTILSSFTVESEINEKNEDKEIVRLAKKYASGVRSSADLESRTRRDEALDEILGISINEKKILM
jgi:hypothetical protein